MRKIFEIIKKNYVLVDAFWGIKRVLDIAEKTKTNLFPVIENNKIIGILTKDDLIRNHPNRIVLDAMSGSYKFIKPEESVWKAKELLEDEIDVLLVGQEDKIIGIVTQYEIELEISKHIDIRTGLYKSEYIIYKSSELLEQGKEISLIFLDINNFGLINKKYGHIIGDIILQETAQVLKENIPEGTYLCRYGGDEFVILSCKSLEESKVLAEDIQNKIKRYSFYNNINIETSVGISGGQKRESRSGNLYKTIINLLNLASLASTKAKTQEGHLILDYRDEIDEIAL